MYGTKRLRFCVRPANEPILVSIYRNRCLESIRLQYAMSIRKSSIEDEKGVRGDFFIRITVTHNSD